MMNRKKGGRAPHTKQVEYMNELVARWRKVGPGRASQREALCAEAHGYVKGIMSEGQSGVARQLLAMWEEGMSDA